MLKSNLTLISHNMVFIMPYSEIQSLNLTCNFLIFVHSYLFIIEQKSEYIDKE